MSETKKLVRLLLFICFGSALAALAASIATQKQWVAMFATAMLAIGVIIMAAELLRNDD